MPSHAARASPPCASFESRTRMGQSLMFSASCRGRLTRKRSAVRQPGMPQGAVVGLARATWSWFALSRFHAVGSARSRRLSDLQRERLGASACCWRRCDALVVLGLEGEHLVVWRGGCGLRLGMARGCWWTPRCLEVVKALQSQLTPPQATLANLGSCPRPLLRAPFSPPWPAHEQAFL